MVDKTKGTRTALVPPGKVTRKQEIQIPINAVFQLDPAAINEGKYGHTSGAQNVWINDGYYQVQLQAWIFRLPTPEAHVTTETETITRLAAITYKER